MGLREKMAAKNAAKQAKKLAAAQPQWAIDRVYKSAAVLEALREAGDDEMAVRPIEHTAIFDSRAAADKFTAGLKPDMGYTIAQVHTSDDSPAVAVEFHETSDTQSRSVFDKTVIAEGRVREAGGVYDGWVTQVVAGK